MPLIVADIIHSKELEDAKVVAGAKGLNNKVTSVTVGEVPDIADWLKGGEIVLSTLFAVGKDTKEQLKFIDSLIKAKAAALLVKPERFIGKLDPKLIELAASFDFPLIVVPPKIRWTEIVGQIYHQIIGHHLSFQKRSFEIHRKLLDQVIKGEGYESIAKTAASLINKPVFIENSDFHLLAESNLGKQQQKLLADFKESEKVDDLGHTFRTRLNNTRFPAKISAPVIVDQDTLGFVSALETKEALNELDLIALEHAATITAVEMGKERIKLETEIRLKGDFIDDLIAKQFQSTDALLKRASFLGCDLTNGTLVLIADIDNFDLIIGQNKYTEDDIQRIRREFFNTANWIISLERKNTLVSLKSDSIIVFLTPQENQDDAVLQSEAQKVAESLQKGLVSRFAKFTFSVGLSSFHANPEKIEKAFNEAKVALDISKRLGQTQKITSFQSVGTYKLLASLLDDNTEELKTFHEETVAALIEYDQKHNSELLKTLETYFASNENINEAAAALFAHRHTVRYRLERIKELCGLDIYNSDDKERLALGLKLSRLL